ncbi:hypothetical protein FBU30_008779 [Linnemannia zychae]|nr:hypothetical protein FBU30_008779 [Linnemannia zychae]
MPYTPLQSLRHPISKQIFQVEVYYHPQLQKFVVLWDDILAAFPRATNVLNGKTVISIARDTDLKPIEPKCIKYYQDTVLDVIETEL